MKIRPLTTKTKKGSILDIAFLTVFLTVVACGILIMYYINAMVKDTMDADPQFGAESIQMVDYSLVAIADWNLVFVFVYVCLNLAVAISAFMVRSHPIMFLVFFIIQVVAVFMSGQMATVWDTLSGNTDDYNGHSIATDATPLFGWIDQIFSNYGVLTLVFSLIIALSMLAIPI